MKKLEDIPNKHGFQFIAITMTGRQIKTEVTKNPNGLHSFPEFKEAIGWIPINTHPSKQ